MLDDHNPFEFDPQLLEDLLVICRIAFQQWITDRWENGKNEFWLPLLLLGSLISTKKYKNSVSLNFV